MEYILHEDQASDLHNKYSIIPLTESYVGIFGHKKYTSIIPTSKVKNIIYSITASPFSFCIKNDINIYNMNLLYELIYTLEAYVQNKTGLKCSGSEIIKYTNVIHIYPMVKSDYIYVSDDESLWFDINPSLLIGYGLISRYNFSVIPLRDRVSITTHKFIYGLMVYSLEIKNYVSDEELERRITEVDFLCADFIQTGKILITTTNNLSTTNNLFTTNSTNNLSTTNNLFTNSTNNLFTNLLMELTQVWGFGRRESPYECIYSCEGSELSHMMNCSFNKWIQDNIHRLMLGKPLIVSITGDWINSLSYGDEKSKLLIHYISILSLRRVAKDNKYMSFVESELVVGPDYMIYVPVWGPEDLTQFKMYINEYKNDLGDYYVHDTDNINSADLLSYNYLYNPVIVEDNIITSSPVLIKEGGITIKEDIISLNIPYQDAYIDDDSGDWVISIDDYDQVMISDIASYTKEQIIDKWTRGDYVSYWGGYLLEVHGMTSVIINK